MIKNDALKYVMANALLRLLGHLETAPPGRRSKKSASSPFRRPSLPRVQMRLDSADDINAPAAGRRNPRRRADAQIAT